jgi:RNA polymerase sigma factor (TIGR02999 family)
LFFGLFFVAQVLLNCPAAMATTQAEDFTRILNAAQAGDESAGKEVFTVIYHELRRLASARMAQEAAGHTLQPTALVHEAWLRLANPDAEWKNRAHFFGAASEAMRRILVDYARRRKSQKRGGGVEPEQLDDFTFVLVAPPDELLAINDALDKLALEDATAAELVKLRYFVGMPMHEAAVALDLSVRTAERLWTYARVWLKREISRDL